MKPILQDRDYFRHGLLVLFVIFLFAGIMDSRHARYLLKPKYTWIKNCLSSYAGQEINFLFIGTSMTMTAIKPKIVDDFFKSKKTAIPSTSLNIANSGGGMGMAYALTNDFLKVCRVNYVVIDEVAITAYTNYHHPYFSRLMPFKEFVFLNKQEMPWSLLMSDGRLYLDRVSQHFNDASNIGLFPLLKRILMGRGDKYYKRKISGYKGRNGFTANKSVLTRKSFQEAWVKKYFEIYPERDLDSEISYVNPANLDEKVERADFLYQVEDRWLQHVPRNRNEFYLKALRKLVQDHGAQFIVVNIPRITDKEIESSHDGYLSMWGDYVRPSQPADFGHLTNFKNPKHMSDKGAEVYSNWLAPVLWEVAKHHEITPKNEKGHSG